MSDSECPAGNEDFGSSSGKRARKIPGKRRLREIGSKDRFRKGTVDSTEYSNTTVANYNTRPHLIRNPFFSASRMFRNILLRRSFRSEKDLGSVRRH